MSEYDDSHMLSKVLERMAAQALHLKDKIDSGLEIPSWAEYKVYNAYSGLGSALGTAYPGEYSSDSMVVKAAAHCMTKHKKKKSMNKKAAATFSKSMDKHPALKGKQSQLPDKIQAGIIKKKLRMRKQAASTESQVLKALSVEGGAAGMGALKKRVKEDDLQSAIKSLIASGKVRKHPDGDLIKESAAPPDSRQQRKQDLRDAGIAAGSLGGSAALVKPSAERLLGVQRYVHGTSDDAADSILQSGLDPAFGASDHGGSAAIGQKRFLDESKGKIHVATDDFIGRRFVAKPHANLAETAAEARKSGKALGREQAVLSFLRGFLPGSKGSMVGGAMPYEEFHSSFEQDPDQVKGHAFRSTRGIDAEDLREGRAGLGDIFRNRSKNLGRYIQDNPGRFGTGLALGTGSLVLAGAGAKSLKDIYDRREGTKQAAATATKTDPAKWEAAKREAKNKMGGKHSARAMQLATQIYKKKGGGYSGAKPTSKNNSLKKWTKQKWNWSGGDKPGPGGKGVYLPKKKAEGLKKSESGRKRLAAASRKKSEATRKGQQYSSHGLAKGTSLKAKK